MSLLRDTLVGPGSVPEIHSESRGAGDEVLCRSARCPRIPFSLKVGRRPASGEVFSVFNLVVYLGASAAALGVGFGAGLIGFYQATVTVVGVICLLALIAGIVSMWTPQLTRQP